MSEPTVKRPLAERDKQELARWVSIEERFAREGKPIPPHVSENIAYYDRRLNDAQPLAKAVVNEGVRSRLRGLYASLVTERDDQPPQRTPRFDGVWLEAMRVERRLDGEDDERTEAS